MSDLLSFVLSILGLLGRKYKIAPAPDIAQWGGALRPSELPQMIGRARLKD